ncbi:uncharacterized protein [Halyomorpha halys]|uniref:uncharacterized protein n=1 Tax=Halyomorpha halys TaxID=286706 RepID=UPI0006D4D568|nr:uncharacterized protein LOC106680340 [Halyomorpha halys]
MGKNINKSVYDLWQSTGCTKFFKDFAVTFAYAFRYYITGLIIGYFFCITFKKFYCTWALDQEYTRPFATQSEDQNDKHRHQEVVDENQQQKDDADRYPRKGTSSDCSKTDGASSNLETLATDRERHPALGYWKRCIDNFGFVVVDTLNPIVPFRRLSDASTTNSSPMTVLWEPDIDNPQEELLISKENKSSSTTDIHIVAQCSQVKFIDIRSIESVDSCVDTHDLEILYARKREISKCKNKKLDTFGLKNLGKDEYDSITHYKTHRNNVILAVTKKLPTTGSKKTVESTLIPGQKVSKNAVIVLRLRDKKLSSCNVFNEDEAFLKNKFSVGRRNRTKHSSYREFLKQRKYSENITSDEISSESLAHHKKTRNLLSFTKFSKNHLHSPLRTEINSDEKCRGRTCSKKTTKQSTGMRKRKNSPKKVDKKLPSHDFSKRHCFKHKKCRKRQKMTDNYSKTHIRSISRFLSEFIKSNPSTTKQSGAAIWTQINPSNNKKVYKIDVKDSANDLQIKPRSKCRSLEDVMDGDKIKKKNIEGFQSNDKKCADMCRASRSLHKILETCHPDSEKQFEISNKKTSSDGGGKKEIIEANYSEISTGSESTSSVELNCQLEDRKKVVESGHVEELIVSLGEGCNKNVRRQFWRFFGSKGSGKPT